ncbi:putative dipeptidase [Alloactinosynnema sp. L-07]|nr:putative dipeptidase [Alloactinosynnema sp. L-07]
MECHEPLIDLRGIEALRVAHPTGARLRRGVVDRLVAAQTLLRTDLRLMVVEGFRPPPPPILCVDPDAHGSGAAVDLTLCTPSGVELVRGQESSSVLGAALSAVGLVNYDAEWWHWSYGDRHWAFATGAVSARYGPVTVP